MSTMDVVAPRPATVTADPAPCHAARGEWRHIPRVLASLVCYFPRRHRFALRKPVTLLRKAEA
jgi:hypothetical protein